MGLEAMRPTVILKLKYLIDFNINQSTFYNYLLKRLNIINNRFDIT